MKDYKMKSPMNTQSKETHVQIPLLDSDETGDKVTFTEYVHQLDGSQLNICNRGTGGLFSKVPHDIKKPVSLSHLPKRPPVDITFSDLSYSVSEGRKRGYKYLLERINGTFKSGELTAIMGPSGAGKSTLMNILAGYKRSNVEGKILINDKERNHDRFRKLSCYIMQDDCLMPHLTVIEAMHIATNLKLGKEITVDTKKLVIGEILEYLGLIDASETRTNKLSGGERKRLSIALELVNNPPVMFLDEPTSGLDSSSCYQCISLLKSLTRGGRTIICTIHQPSARLFEMFDYLYTLSEAQCIYQGPVKSLVSFLSKRNLNCPENHNIADYLMEVATGVHGQCLDKLVKAVNEGNDGREQTPSASFHISLVPQNMNNTSQTNKIDKTCKNEVPIGDKPNTSNLPPVTCSTSLTDFPTSGLEQVWILLKRTLVCICRDHMLTLLRGVSHLVVGFLLAILCYNIGNDASKIESNAGCIFFTVLFTMFTAMMPTVLTFPTEMSVFIREHLNYWYSLEAYYLAKTIADIPFQVLFTSVYVTIIYYLTGQPWQTERIIMFLLINILTSLVAQSFGLLIGAAMKIETGVYIGPVTSIPTVLFAGFFVNFKVIPFFLKWLSYASYFRYGFEGSMLAVYGYERTKLNCSVGYCRFRESNNFLKDMTMDKSNFWVDVGALCGFLVCIKIVTYFVLKIKLKMMQ